MIRNSKDKSKKDKSPIRLDTGAAIMTGLLVLIIVFGTFWFFAFVLGLGRWR
jgi:hypothetical protein